MNIQAMMKQAQKLQKEMTDTKNKIDNMEFVGKSSAVTVTVNGKKQILNVKITGEEFSNEDIEEIASDVFLVIWKNKEKLDSNKEITPYIAGITKKLILKRKSNVKNNGENIEEYENSLYEKNSDIHIKIEENEKINILTNELTKMKEEDKNIFTYYYYQSKSINDISSVLKISQIKVKSRLSRIRKKLKKELEKRGYGYERR